MDLPCANGICQWQFNGHGILRTQWLRHFLDRSGLRGNLNAGIDPLQAIDHDTLLGLQTQDLGLASYARLALLISLGALVYVSALAILAPATLRLGLELARATLGSSTRERTQA